MILYVAGKAEFERFDNAMRRVLSVSKEKPLKREAREKKHANKRVDQRNDRVYLLSIA